MNKNVSVVEGVTINRFGKLKKFLFKKQETDITVYADEAKDFYFLSSNLNSTLSNVIVNVLSFTNSKLILINKIIEDYYLGEKEVITYDLSKTYNAEKSEDDVDTLYLIDNVSVTEAVILSRVVSRLKSTPARSMVRYDDQDEMLFLINNDLYIKTRKNGTSHNVFNQELILKKDIPEFVVKLNNPKY